MKTSRAQEQSGEEQVKQRGEGPAAQTHKKCSSFLVFFALIMVHTYTITLYTNNAPTGEVRSKESPHSPKTGACYSLAAAHEVCRCPSWPPWPPTLGQGCSG